MPDQSKPQAARAVAAPPRRKRGKRQPYQSPAISASAPATTLAEIWAVLDEIDVRRGFPKEYNPGDPLPMAGREAMELTTHTYTRALETLAILTTPAGADDTALRADRAIAILGKVKAVGILQLAAYTEGAHSFREWAGEVAALPATDEPPSWPPPSLSPDVGRQIFHIAAILQKVIGDLPPRTTVTPEGEEVTSLDQWPLHAALEVMELCRAFADGRYGRDYTPDTQAGVVRHRTKGARHYTEFRLTEEEWRAVMDAGMDRLMDMTQRLDADGAWCVHYVLGCLKHNINNPNDTWLSLDDIIARLGWDPRSTFQRREMRRRIWDYLLAGARAWVIGDRQGKYKDPDTQQPIPTRIASPPWTFTGTEHDAQRELFSAMDVPLQVALQPGSEWRTLLRTPQMAQYLDGAERVMQIPGGKAAGAWARSIGMSLLMFWRRHASEEPAKRPKPTRRELLYTFLPTTSPPNEVFRSKNPSRAITYWRDALRALVDAGTVADEGEATAVLTAKRPAGYNWQAAWLDEAVELRLMNEAWQSVLAVEERALKRARRKPAAKALPPRRKPS